MEKLLFFVRAKIKKGLSLYGKKFLSVEIKLQKLIRMPSRCMSDENRLAKSKTESRSLFPLVRKPSSKTDSRACMGARFKT